MGTTGPWRTPFGSAQRAHSNHPPPGSDKPIIKGLLRVAAPIREVLDHAHVDPSPPPQGFALLGQALARAVSGFRPTAFSRMTCKPDLSSSVTSPFARTSCTRWAITI